MRENTKNSSRRTREGERNCDRDTKLDGRVAFRKRGRQSRVKTVLASWRLNLQKIAKMSIKQVAKNKKG